MPANNMNRVATHSTCGELKWPMLASYEEKPPRLMVEHM